MSLSEQSQQWYPTSVQVTVLQARGLRIKGKNGTNDAYAIMQVAKEKFSTSVAEKSVAPAWKEEASFDLPLFHAGNAERCALQVSVMHRALVGPDKTLGLTIVKLSELYDNKSRNKSEWFKLMGKTGKPDKDRGEVLLDIQFMKNNMTASMFDLSGTDKSRSKFGKLKDKLKGKKKDGMSDSASAIVPSISQILTDSEGEEADATPETKKKSKLKSLFAPKGLHRNISQSMSTLPTLPEKDSAISLSRSSGLNVESPEGKKKFKLFKHKRTDSSDSKVSQGAGSLLGQGMSQPNLCINGSHVYTEDPETRGSRAGSTLSLNSSGHGSMEDLRRAPNRKISTISVDLQTPQSDAGEMLKRQEEVRKRLEEERRRQIQEEEREEMRMEEERKRIEREEERKRIEREEEMMRLEKLEEEKRRIKREEERMEMEEERKRIEREEEIMRLEKLEEEKRRMKREEERMEMEEERKRIEREEERMEMEEERRRMKREEERMEMEEERKRIEREEEMMRLEKLEEEKRRIKREEERKRIEREMEERRRVEEEEMERKEEMARIKREHEEERKAEEERIRADGRMREEEERRIREERARLEKERMKIEEETRMIEAEKRLRKEKMEAEERKRGTAMEKETKERERLRLEKEKMELERKEKMKMEQERKKAEEEEEERTLKAEQEKAEMEKKKKEQMNAIEKRPDVKPRSARMNAGKKAEKADTIGSEYVPSIDPFEESLLLDENSEALSHSSKVYAVKPSSSVSGIVFSQPSPPNTNPLLDDSDAESSNTDNISSGDVSESSEKKRRAPMPPQNKTPRELSRSPVSKATYSRRESEDRGEPDVFSLRQDKRLTPLPPDVSRNSEVLNKDCAEEFTTSFQEETNLFISSVARTAKHSKGPAPAKPSLKPQDTLKENSASLPEPKKRTIHHNQNFTLFPDEASLTSDSCLDQPHKPQSDHDLDDFLISVKPALKPESKESGKKDLNTDGTKKKSPAPLPPATTGDQKSTSQLDGQDQDRTLRIHSGLSTSPTLKSQSTVSQAPETARSHGSGNKTLLQARVSPIDAQTVSGQNYEGEPKRKGDAAFKPSRPHAVKPLSTIDNQQDFRENQDNFTSAKIAEGVQVKMKAPDVKRTEPYAQLTHEELVNLLEKQKDQLSQKDAKITELEQYIDNLLVRVMEEQPSILMSLNAMKKSV